MSVGDRIRRTGFHAVSAKNAAVVIDVVDLGITLGAADPLLSRVLCRLDIDAIGWAVGCAKKTRHALLQAILIALQNMHAAKPLLKLRTPQRPWPIGIVLHRRWLKHLHEGDAHALRDGGNVLNDGHTR